MSERIYAHLKGYLFRLNKLLFQKCGVSKTGQASLDEDARRGIRKLKELLANPTEFEKWANETLDVSRLRKR